ncbi:hypothetical protein FH063_006396 [Azospirillum argentinense]|uniref:Uncharacterized protein n=1 Tax=Azospirillum argentinense TaxID=2970906 RepID=A0A5B0KRH0_9PROT|nr:hypothetical protein FH063_006396 [Azospirillum argentinense]
MPGRGGQDSRSSRPVTGGTWQGEFRRRPWPVWDLRPRRRLTDGRWPAITPAIARRRGPKEGIADWTR